jgi:hypothetical protein
MSRERKCQLLQLVGFAFTFLTWLFMQAPLIVGCGRSRGRRTAGTTSVD